MSAGQFFGLIMPAAFAASALISTWVLASARRRFQLHYAVALAVGALFLPLIIVPVYLVLMMWRPKIGPPRRWRYSLPLLYGAIALSAIFIYFYFDDRSVDAHLARATQAKLVDDSRTAIREYREALARDDDPHTHKLLAIELANAGEVREAISEFRLAEAGGEPDDSIHYALGLLLEKLDLTSQAAMEFEKFLMSATCEQADARCDAARERLKNFSST